MVHKEGGGPASECKIEKNTIRYGGLVQLIRIQMCLTKPRCHK